MTTRAQAVGDQASALDSLSAVAPRSLDPELANDADRRITGVQSGGVQRTGVASGAFPEASPCCGQCESLPALSGTDGCFWCLQLPGRTATELLGRLAAMPGMSNPDRINPEREHTLTLIRALHPMPGLAWTEIRDEAVALATHGWSVLPGTYQVDDDGEWLGKHRAGGLEPIADIWTMASTTDPTVAQDWWTRRPYSVLLACGIMIDAFEVPQAHSEQAMMRLRERKVSGPVAMTPFGSLLFFARTGVVDADRVLDPEIRWHSDGAWVPLPPTTRSGALYRWRVAPQDSGWCLPSVTHAYRALSEPAR